MPDLTIAPPVILFGSGLWDMVAGSETELDVGSEVYTRTWVLASSGRIKVGVCLCSCGKPFVIVFGEGEREWDSWFASLKSLGGAVVEPNVDARGRLTLGA